MRGHKKNNKARHMQHTNHCNNIPKTATCNNSDNDNKKRRKVQKKITFEEQERNKYAHLKNSGAMFGTTNSIVYCSHTVSMRCGNCKCASI